MKELMSRVSREVESLRGLAARFLEAIVSIPTVSPWGHGYEDFAKASKELLEAEGVSVEIHRVPQDYVDRRVPAEGRGRPRYIVIARTEGRPAVHFNGHYDVVPGGPGWRVTEPFSPRIVGDRLYGRGSTDMKGGIASIATALVAISRIYRGAGPGAEAAFVPDEEIGGETGTGYLVERGLVGARSVVIAEPSGLAQVYMGHKGAVWGEVVVRGRTGHGSTPWLGVNAFEKATLLAREMFERLVPAVEARRSKYAYDLEEGSRATIMIGGLLRGGEKINQIPGEVVFSFDRRLVVEERTEEAWEEVRRLVEEAARRLGVDAEVRLVHRMEPVLVDPGAGIFRAVEEAARAAAGISPRRVVCIGGLDMRYYAARGYEVATYGPGVLGAAHAPDEHIELGDVERAAKIYALLPALLQGGGDAG